MDRAEIVRSLGLCCPFQDMPAAELEALLPDLRTHEVAAGSLVWRQGDPADTLWFVVSGHVSGVMTSVDGEQVVVEVAGEGESFGAPTLFLNGGVRLVDVLALAPATLLSLRREPLLGFLERHPAALRRMLESMSMQVVAQAVQVTQVAFLDVRGRVAYQLLRLAREYGEPDPDGIRIPFRMSQATLAGMVASSRETVNRALGGFATTGVVTQRAGFFVVRDRASLEAVVAEPR